jgi:hypothetical protein
MKLGYHFPSQHKSFITLSILVMALATFFVANNVCAEVAPPDQPPDADLGPASATQVQMISESVSIEVGEVVETLNPQRESDLWVRWHFDNLEPTHTPQAASTSATTPAYPSPEDKPLPAGRLWVMGALLVLCMGVFGAAIVVIGAVVRANRPQ